jgi:hypothetical protein
VSKQRHYPALRLTVIHALERTAPAGRPRVEWKLITDLPVNYRAFRRWQADGCFDVQVRY